ncbi:MAG: hypothetical protein IJP24_01825, partial [Firmicutes bacterium]|nr:hypothetical protein [Bacillota bacterium]
ITVIATGFEDRPKSDGIFINNRLGSDETVSAEENAAAAETVVEEKHDEVDEMMDKFNQKYTTDFVIPDFLKGNK